MEESVAVITHAQRFVRESIEILEKTSADDLEAMARVLRATRDRDGRLFFLGSGGGAGHASHAACDFRKLAGFEAYCVSDNVSELTARVNDDGWDGAYASWLVASRLRRDDCLFVFSVGGGDAGRGISTNLVRAMDLATEVGASIVGVAGRDGGHLKKVADACVIVPTIEASNVTAQAEGFQALFWHLLIMHPDLSASTPKWESTR